MTTVFLALGSNLGDRRAALEAAVAALAPFMAVRRRSPVYETAPMYVTDQPAFLNMALEGDTGLPPAELLKRLKDIEAAQGRAADGARFGPRPIDIDILIYGDLVLDTPELAIPHPRLEERAFVLCPLADIAPDLRHPAHGRTAADMLATVEGRDTVVRLP